MSATSTQRAPRKAPDVADIAVHKASVEAAKTGLPAWEAARASERDTFKLLGMAGAAGSISLTQLGLAFSAAVASGLYAPDEAKAAYADYCAGWNDAAASQPAAVRAEPKATSGASFDASVAMFSTFGKHAAVAQSVATIDRDSAGKPVKCNGWSDRFYEAVANIWRAIPEGRVDSLYSAFVAVNRAACNVAIEDGCQHGLLVRALTEDEIRTACTKAETQSSHYARVIKALTAAHKAAKKCDPVLAHDIDVMLDDANAAMKRSIDRDKNDAVNAATLVNRAQRAMEAAPANILPAE